MPSSTAIQPFSCLTHINNALTNIITGEVMFRNEGFVNTDLNRDSGRTKEMRVAGIIVLQQEISTARNISMTLKVIKVVIDL